MVSPYLNRPLRSLDEVLQARGQADRAAPERRAPTARGGVPQPGELAPRHTPKAMADDRYVEATARRKAA